MNVSTTGLSEGDFHRLAVLHNGSMTNIIALIGSLGGGSVNSATKPLNISAGVLSIDLSAYTTTAGLTTLLAGKIGTTHEANKIGAADATHLFDFKSQTLTLRNGAGVQAVLSVDNGGNVRIGSDGIVTILILNAWSPTLLRLSDSGGTSRLLKSFSDTSTDLELGAVGGREQPDDTAG